MIKVAEVINLIGNTSSTNDKLYLLKRNENVPGLKEILKFIYNPYCKTGISDKKLEKAQAFMCTEKGVTWKQAIEYFTRNQTGTDSDLAFARAFIGSTPDEAKWLAEAIVTQDLKIGVTATSLNKAYGKDFIPKIGCMLGTLYGDVGPQKTKWPCIVTEKLDGIRRILIKENGVVKCFSRSGHEDTGLIEIIEEAKHLPDNCVYDGELLAEGIFKDSIALRQATNSIANSSGNKTGLTFNVFDMVPVDEFKSGISKQDALNRKFRLGATLRDNSIVHLSERWYEGIQVYGIDAILQHIKPVPILGQVKNMSEVEPIVASIWARGGEGVMLNTVSGKYEIKRSKDLLKVKHTEEHTLIIVDMLEGTGKYEGMLGALIVEYKGNKLGVGSGFTDAQRQRIWDNYNEYIGRSVEIETFGESQNSFGEVSLNCPIFKRFVGEVE